MDRSTTPDNLECLAGSPENGDGFRRLQAAGDGSYTLTRPLGACAVGDRFLALHNDRQTSHVAYRMITHAGRSEMARLEAVFELAASLRHPHVLAMQELIVEPATQSGGDAPLAWIITPFCGDADGLRSLARLVRAKGGQLSQIEAEQAITQVLEALACAHGNLRGDGASMVRSPVFHGPLSLEEILVDSHGRIVIEMLGVARRMRGMLSGNTETVRDEIVRVCEIAYQLLTGLRAETPLIPATRLVPRLSRAWDQWLKIGLDPSRGFESAAHALSLLPAAVEDRGVVVRPVRAAARV